MKITAKLQTHSVQKLRAHIIHRFNHCRVCEQRLQFEYFYPSVHQISEFPYCMICGARFKTNAHTLH